MILSTTYITKSERFFKNPLVFDPNRWVREINDDVGVTHPYANLPFGFGVRNDFKINLTNYLKIISFLRSDCFFFFKKFLMFKFINFYPYKN